MNHHGKDNSSNKILKNIQKIQNIIHGAKEELLEKKQTPIDVKHLFNNYKPEHREKPEVKSHIDWAMNSLPMNNWRKWATNAHAKNMDSFTPEIKEQIEHYAGMHSNSPEIQDVKFAPQDDFKAGLNKLKAAEAKYQEKYQENEHYLIPNKDTKEIVKTGENRGWHDIGKGTCNDEGGAMGHCGNPAGDERGDKLLSLRDTIKVGDKVYHEPHLTFAENNGYLGEMKGRSNEKPKPKYHKDIVELLKHPRIKGLVGGGLEDISNFHFSDLSKEHQEEVLKANPNLITDNKDINKLLLDRDLPEHILYEVVRDNKNIDPKHYDHLVNHKNDAIRKNIATRNNLNLEQQKQLVNDKNEYVRSTIASNKNIDPRYIDQLIKDKDPKVRAALAYKHDLDPKYHEQLVNDKDLLVRKLMASNPNLDPKYHEQLVNDESFSVGGSVAGSMASNPNLDPKYHEQLVNNKDAFTRMGIASNPNLDPKYHEQLINDESPLVHEALISNPNLDPKYHEQLINGGNINLIRTLARNPKLSAENVEKMLNTKDESTLHSLAENPNLDPKFYDRFVNSDNYGFRSSIANNPNLDPKFYDKLLNDDYEEVRSNMQFNPSYIKYKEGLKKSLRHEIIDISELLPSIKTKKKHLLHVNGKVKEIPNPKR